MNTEITNYLKKLEFFDCLSLKNGVENNMCCKVYTEEEWRSMFNDFVTFCNMYMFNSIKKVSEVFKRNIRKGKM